MSHEVELRVLQVEPAFATNVWRERDDAVQSLVRGRDPRAARQRTLRQHAAGRAFGRHASRLALRLRAVTYEPRVIERAVTEDVRLAAVKWRHAFERHGVWYAFA